ncbi:MAG: OmpH family outer membrane protein [Kiritimatiellae bacterium]|nr:OmpH family outer membrane protein [Kiritimatiellia bacterium]
MKNVMMMAVAVMVAAVSFAGGIAVVDMEKILEAHPNTPNDKKLLETTLDEYSKERDALRKVLDEKQAALEKMVKSAQNPMLAPAKAAELKKSCETAYQELEQARESAEMQMQQRSRELSELERRLIKRTSEEVVEQIAAYAKAQGYDAVIYKNVVPYVAAELEITQKIIELCGGKVETVKAAKPVKKDTSKAAEELAPPAKF